MINEPRTKIDPKFEMLAAYLAIAFEATQTQPNLGETVTSPQSVPVTSPQRVLVTSTQSAPITSAHSSPVTSSQTNSSITLSAPDYILSAPVPTIDEVPVAHVSTTHRVNMLSLLNHLIMT